LKGKIYEGAEITEKCNRTVIGNSNSGRSGETSAYMLKEPIFKWIDLPSKYSVVVFRDYLDSFDLDS
jgi:hypothetical protein